MSNFFEAQKISPQGINPVVGSDMQRQIMQNILQTAGVGGPGTGIAGMPSYPGQLSPNINQTNLPGYFGNAQLGNPGMQGMYNYNAMIGPAMQYGTTMPNNPLEGLAAGGTGGPMQGLAPFLSGGMGQGAPGGAGGALNPFMVGGPGSGGSPAAGGQPFSGLFSQQSAGGGGGASGGMPIGYMQQMAGGGGAATPVSALPAWQAMVAAQQRNISEGSANLASQFNTSGDRFSTDYGNAATDYQLQATLGQNALLGQMQLPALLQSQQLQAGAGTQLGQMQYGAGQQLAGEQFGAGQGLLGAGLSAGQGLNQAGMQALLSMPGAAGTQANIWQSQLANQLQSGMTQYGLGQQQIGNQYQEWMRTQPQYNPLMNYMSQIANTYPQMYQPSYQPSIFGQMAGGLGGLMGGIGAMGSGGIFGCWIAEAIYGVDDIRTHLVRSWLNGAFKRSLMGVLIMKVYLLLGRRVASLVKKHALLKRALRPVFNLALRKAIGY